MNVLIVFILSKNNTKYALGGLGTIKDIYIYEELKKVQINQTFNEKGMAKTKANSQYSGWGHKTVNFLFEKVLQKI